MSRASTQQVLKQLPLSWSIGILLLLVGYWFAQPMLNSRLGWQLPSLANVIGEAEPPTKNSQQAGNRSTDQAEPTTPTQPTAPAQPTTPKPTPAQPGPTEAESDQQAPAASSSAASSATPERGNLLYGLLQDTGRQRYLSPAGLQYNPGSEEGHRLKHLERHLQDQPDRPGKHGVFEGDMAQTLKWIDDAYTRGQQRARGVQVRQEGNRTIYEAPFGSPIGYIGGRDGQRSGNPSARRLRLVVEGSRFITAFPF